MTSVIKEANPQEENPQEPEKVVHGFDDDFFDEPVIKEEIKTSPNTKVVVKKKPDVHYTGFQRPFHVLQVVSWIVFAFDFFTYFLINMVSLFNHSLVLVILASLVYLSLTAAVLYYAIKATKSDPSDPIIYEQRLCEAKG